MKRKTITGLCLSLLLQLLLLAPASPLLAFDPVFRKVIAPAVTPPNSAALFGSAVALGDTYALVGEYGNDEDGVDPDTAQDEASGAVHVFNAATGAYVRKLRAPDAALGGQFGYSVAIEGKLAVVGSPFLNSSQGAVYVMDVTTGKQVQKLVASSPVSGDALGYRVAIHNNRVLAAASGRNANRGAIYIWDNVHVPNPTPRTESRIFEPPSAAASDSLRTIAVAGTLGVAGALSGDGAVTDSGVVYLFDTDTGSYLKTLSAPDGEAGDLFGNALAISGGRLVVGAYVTGAGEGVVHVFDLRTGERLYRLAAPNPAAEGAFAFAVAAQGNLALISVGSFSGKVYAFSLVDGRLIGEITPPDGRMDVDFGDAVALHGTRALIGSQRDGEGGFRAGSAYLISPLAAPFPLPAVAKKNNFAPNVIGATFTGFGESFINDDGEAMFPATVAGTGVTAANNRGVWTELRDGVIAIGQRSGIDFTAPLGTARPTTFSNVIGNQPDFTIYQATLTGPGAAGGNNMVLLGTNGTSLTPLMQIGRELTGNGGLLKPAAFLQVVQPMFDPRQSVVARFRTGSGTDPATLTSDTGVMFLQNDGAVQLLLREGDVPTVILGLATDYGQFSRASHYHDELVATVGLAGDPLKNQGVMQYNATTDRIQFRRGFAMYDTNGFNHILTTEYSTFTGETSSFSEELVLRATLRGTGVTTLNNEGLWWEHDPDGHSGSFYDSDPRLALREGEPYASLPAGVVISQFVQFWALDVVDAPPMPNIRGQILLLATLRGTGVNTSNDRALLLLEETNPPKLRVLMREGELAVGCEPARIGAISRIVCSPYYAQYAVQVTLTGAPASSNLALYRGTTVVLPSTIGMLRRPLLALRKGALCQGGNGNATVTSFALPTTGMDATGAGGKGLGQPINRYGEMTFAVTFSDGSVHLVKGAP